MMMFGRRTLAAAAVLAVLVVTSAGCGASYQAVEAKPGASPLALETGGSVNGKALSLFVATTALDRARGEASLDFAKKDKPAAAAFVYGAVDGKEVALNLSPDFSTPADLVFVDKGGTAVKVYGQKDANYYVPVGTSRSKATGYENGPSVYSSGKPASVALFLPLGMATEAGITEGGKVTVSPDVLAKVEKAESSQLMLYFRERTLKEPERNEPKPFAKIVVNVASKGEDRARGLMDGQNALLLLYQDQDTDWAKRGFWTKGIKDDVSFAFMRLQQDAGGGAQTFMGVVSDIVEGVKDGGEDDSVRPIWYPSKTRVQNTDSVTGNSQHNSVSGPVNAVLILRGAKAFTELKVEEDYWVLGTSMFIQTPGGSPTEDTQLVQRDNVATTSILIDGKRYGVNMAKGRDAIEGAAVSVSGLAANTVSVIAWDSATGATLSNFGPKELKLGLLEGTGGIGFKISSVLSIPSDKRDVAIDGQKSRFALISRDASIIKEGASVELPWQVVHTRPVLRQGVFYHGKKPLKYPTTGPKDSLARVRLEIAQSETEIERGLMYRKSLPTDTGMLFVLGRSEVREFWMKNCEMDIDVAFIDKDGVIVTVHEMKKEAAGTTDLELKRYSSRGAATYAVEMEGGWYAKKGIKAGDRVWLPLDLREKE
jgi:uncharacterized membrane protein (UPF0127 family)